jgi:hypothetical protein
MLCAKHISTFRLLSILLVIVLGLGSSLALAESESIIDYLCEMSTATRGNGLPAAKTNLSNAANNNYVASWSKVYEYTYTNYQMCTGNSNKRFKLTLKAHCYGDNSENPPTDGKISVEVYTSSGSKVKTFTSRLSEHPSFTQYYTPSSSSAYYYFKIKLIDCVGYSSGKLTISLADK